MGIDKHAPDEADLLRPLAELKLSTLRIDKIPGKSVRRLSDFHTIGGGWIDDWKADKGNLFAKMKTPRKAGDGSPFGTVITHRTYLTDARFLVVLEGEESVLQRCASALEDPKWGVWFGRKSCLPAAPLSPTLASTGSEAIALLAKKVAMGDFEVEKQTGQRESASEDAWYQSDQPISFGRREFQSRPITRVIERTENKTNAPNEP